MFFFCKKIKNYSVQGAIVNNDMRFIQFDSDSWKKNILYFSINYCVLKQESILFFEIVYKILILIYFQINIIFEQCQQ